MTLPRAAPWQICSLPENPACNAPGSLADVSQHRRRQPAETRQARSVSRRGDESAGAAGQRQQPGFLRTQARAYQAKGQPDDAWLGYLKAIGQDGTEELVTAFQYALKQQGLYQGAVDAQKSPDLEKAIEACVRKPDCSLGASR